MDNDASLWRWRCCAPAHAECFSRQLMVLAEPSCPYCRLFWSEADSVRCRLWVDEFAVRVSCVPAWPSIPVQRPSCPNIVALCCPRRLTLDVENTRDRRMVWFPYLSAATREWHLEWSCMTCGQRLTIQEVNMANGVNPPSCGLHGVRQRALCIDVFSGKRWWVCTWGTRDDPDIIFGCESPVIQNDLIRVDSSPTVTVSWPPITVTDGTSLVTDDETDGSGV